MKQLAAILAVFLLIACRERPFDGHADGEMSVGVEVIARDSVSGRALEEVRVTFFSRHDQALLRQIDAMRAKDGKNMPAMPAGTSANTDRQGRALLACRFDAAFMFRERPSNIVRSEWRPGGILQFEKVGFATIRKELSSVFLSPPYTGDHAPAPITVEMNPEPNQSLQPTAPSGRG